MNEVERARDRATVALCYSAAWNTKDANHKAALTEAAFDLDVASKRQDDEDCNGARRAMGKHDCPEAPCVFSKAACGVCAMAQASVPWSDGGCSDCPKRPKEDADAKQD